MKKSKAIKNKWKAKLKSKKLWLVVAILCAAGVYNWMYPMLTTVSAV